MRIIRFSRFFNKILVKTVLYVSLVIPQDTKFFKLSPAFFVRNENTLISFNIKKGPEDNHN